MEPQGKPKNTGVGSLPLLQQIFPTQESNQGLLHCRQILHQLSYERSPYKFQIVQMNPKEFSVSYVINMQYLWWSVGGEHLSDLFLAPNLLSSNTLAWNPMDGGAW